MSSQVVDLRVGVGIDFGGDAAARQAYVLQCRQMREAMAARGVHYAVAPRQTLRAHDGRVLRAGDALQPELDLAPLDLPGTRGVQPEHRPVWRQLRDLVEKGIVLEADVPPPRSAA